MHAMKAVKKELDSMSRDEKKGISEGAEKYGIRMVYDDDEGCGYGDPPPPQQDKNKKDKKGKGKQDKMPKPSSAPLMSGLNDWYDDGVSDFDESDFDEWFESVGTQCWF